MERGGGPEALCSVYHAPASLASVVAVVSCILFNLWNGGMLTCQLQRLWLLNQTLSLSLFHCMAPPLFRRAVCDCPAAGGAHQVPPAPP